MLYIIPTPIGNLKDFSFRSIEICQNVDLILAEDTRTSKKLLDHYNISAKLSSFHTHNEHKRVDQIVQMMEAGQDIALMSDAGTPGISDPGFLIVRACREKGIEVACLPGPTAFVPALVSSGLPSDKFHFEGFLPHKKGRQSRIKYLASLENTFIIYESPHRILKCLDQLTEFCGLDRSAFLAREISKLHEEHIGSSLSEIKKELLKKPTIKGEIVLVVAGKDLKSSNSV